MIVKRIKYDALQASYKNFKSSWAEFGIEIECRNGWETDMGGFPIWGTYHRIDTGDKIGLWGIDGNYLDFPDGHREEVAYK